MLICCICLHFIREKYVLYNTIIWLFTICRLLCIFLIIGFIIWLTGHMWLKSFIRSTICRSIIKSFRSIGRRLLFRILNKLLISFSRFRYNLYLSTWLFCTCVLKGIFSYFLFKLLDVLSMTHGSFSFCYIFIKIRHLLIHI